MCGLIYKNMPDMDMMICDDKCIFIGNNSQPTLGGSVDKASDC